MHLFCIQIATLVYGFDFISLKGTNVTEMLVYRTLITNKKLMEHSL